MNEVDDHNFKIGEFESFFNLLSVLLNSQITVKENYHNYNFLLLCVVYPCISIIQNWANELSIYKIAHLYKNDYLYKYNII